MNVTLTGKTAIVTGAASGIGLATVLQFLEAGADGVVAVDLAAEPPESLRPHTAGRVRYVRGDVSAEETARCFTREAMDSFGRIDVLVNNAGVSVVKPLHEHTPEEWDFVMGVNVKAVCLAGRHVIPIMMKQKSGVILNTGSISGQVGIPGQGAYGPSKGALHLMTKQMAVEYAPMASALTPSAAGQLTRPSSTKPPRTPAIPTNSGRCSRTITPSAGSRRPMRSPASSRIWLATGRAFHWRHSDDGRRIYREMRPTNYGPESQGPRRGRHRRR